MRTDDSLLWIHKLIQFRPTSIIRSKLICEWFEIANPGKEPMGHDVHKLATTLIYIEGGNTQTITILGQWASLFGLKYCYFSSSSKIYYFVLPWASKRMMFASVIIS